ncbi:MAG: amidohydrolase [Deltaproteobacteria bacterium]|nr:amidohydrolase [Deltaproteobacteria bacterium]
MPARPNDYLARLIEDQGSSERVTFIDEPDAEPLFCPLISVDDHVLEPADLFEERVPSRLREAAPRLVHDAAGIPFWQIDQKRLPIIMLNGIAGRTRGEWKAASRARFEEFRASVLDPRRRLADMDLTGVWASLCFPSAVWGFAGWRFARMRDPVVGLASLRAYNDWMLEAWCGTSPDRYIPCQIPWLADAEIAASEIRSNADRGFRAVSFSENPEGLGFPAIYGPDWDPFFAACEETGTVINLHVGSSGRTPNPSSMSPPDAVAALFPLSGIETVVDWIFARIPIRFPKLQIVLSEAGVSWVPMVAERLRRAHRMRESSEAWSLADPDPASLLCQNFFFTSLEDPSAFHQLDLIGADRVMIEMDFPHQDSTWPECQALVRGELSHLPRKTVQQICFGTAADLYRHPSPPPDWMARSEVA